MTSLNINMKIIIASFLVLLAIICLLVTRKNHSKRYKRKKYKNITDKVRIGELAELRIIETIDEVLDERVHETFHNLYVPIYDGSNKTTEIDVVMLDRTGIYVIESKDYTGVITGKKNDKEWVKTYYNTNKETDTYTFYNPIKQNNTHIKALSHFLDVPLENFHSLIVFSNKCKLKNVPKDFDNTVITQMWFLEAYLLNDVCKKKSIMTENQIKNLAKRMNACTNISDRKKEKIAKKHIKNQKNH